MACAHVPRAESGPERGGGPGGACRERGTPPYSTAHTARRDVRGGAGAAEGAAEGGACVAAGRRIGSGRIMVREAGGWEEPDFRDTYRPPRDRNNTDRYLLRYYLHLHFCMCV